MRRTGLLLAATALLVVALAGVALAATVKGDDANNELRGTRGPDTIRAFGGDDTVRGLRSNDEVRGGPGGDTLYGDRGGGTFYAGQGSDQVFGGRGDDVIHVEGDNAPGSSTRDRVDCGHGFDTVYLDAGSGFPGPDLKPADSVQDDCDDFVVE